MNDYSKPGTDDSSSVAFSQFFCSQDPDYRMVAVVEAHTWQTSVELTLPVGPR